MLQNLEAEREKPNGRGLLPWHKEEMGSGSRRGVRVLLTSTRFVASLFWLTIVVATMLFVIPYSERSNSPAFYWFLAMSIAVYLGHRFFPFEGYHPWLFSLLQLTTDALIAVMVYLTGGSKSGLSLLFVTVVIFSSAYFELPESLLITAITCAVYFAPALYENLEFGAIKEMAMTVPVYFLVCLSGYFVISKAREQEREKKELTLLYDQAERKQRELSALYAASLKFASTLNDQEIVDILMETAGKLVPEDAALLCLYDGRGKLSIRASRGLTEPERFLEGDEEHNPLYVSAAAVLPVILSESDPDPRFSTYLQKSGFASMITAPLFASSSVIGVLSCLSTSSRTFDDEEARLLLTLCSEAALALEKAGLYRTTLEDKSKIETIINTLTDGLLVINRDARLLMANPSVVGILGLPDDPKGIPLEKVFTGGSTRLEFREMPFEEALRTVLREGRYVKNELLAGNGHEEVYQVLWVPLRDVDGTVSGAVILLHDVTDFVELDRMKSNFISIVSHELKTPLTSIRGFVRLLETGRVGPVNEKQRHYLDIVLEQTDSLTQLIEDLLDLSRIEAGIIEVRREKVNVQKVISGVLDRLENLAKEKGVRVRVCVPEDLPPVAGDADRLAQVFTNLIHNAIKFTPSGGEVKLEAAADGEECLLKVSDTGIGISPQDLPRVFDKFYQADSSSTREQSGTGLGLSISRELVAAHGGKMWVESSRGRGATFSFTLPLWSRRVEEPEEVESGA